MTESVSEWLALVIEKVDEKLLLPDVIRSDDERPHLPTQMVKMPFDDPNKVAVVSWRWDGDLQTRGSRNIASIIQVAKQRGIRYLFIDIISIDQKLPPNDLIKAIAAYSVLYTKITVLAAYDMVQSNWLDFRFTILRPWILNEMRLFRQNAGNIVYVGHSHQGSHLSNFVSQHILPTRNQTKRPRFENLLERTWFTSFVDSIIGVLLGEVGMSFISDFQYIIQPCSHVLSAAYQQMERNDYLLTAAIICWVHGSSKLLVWGQDLERSIQYLPYCRYSFVEVRSCCQSFSWTCYNICLDRTPVAQWNHKYNDYREYHEYEFNTLANTERVIFAALGLSQSEYEGCKEEKEARSSYLGLLNDKRMPVPNVEVIEVQLSK